MFEIFRDEKKRAIIDQFIFVAVAGLIIYYLGNNLVQNLNKLGISTGFGFLWETSGYKIGGSLIPYDDYSTYGRAHIVGLLNTILSTSLIIVSASLLGFILGIMRMSQNPLLNNTIRYLIELIRNIPSLVHIVIWFTLILRFPSVRSSFSIGDVIFINNRGINLPLPLFKPLAWIVIAIFFVLLVIAYIRRKRAILHMIQTGKFHSTFLTNTIMIWGGTIVAYLILGSPITWEIPRLEGFNFKGGINMIPELFVMWIALSIYFASHVAELVRGGIQSVSKGQSEAGKALGVKSWIIIRHIVIPQALRVIVPPLTTVYQNILKTTSLGVAIGFTEMAATTGGTTLNLTGQAVECILILMFSYGTISLIIAWIMNVINKQVAITES